MRAAKLRNVGTVATRALVLGAASAVLFAACNQVMFDDCDSVPQCVGTGFGAVGAGGADGASGDVSVSSLAGRSGSDGDSTGASATNNNSEAGNQGGVAGTAAVAGAGAEIAKSGCETGGKHVSAPGFLKGWAYRRPVSISNTHSSRYDYTLPVNVSFPSCQVRPDLGDLRVTGADGETQVPFYVERVSSSGDTTSAEIWVRPAAISQGTTPDALFLYVGNPSATSVADGRASFEVFDGFEDYPVGPLARGAGYVEPIGSVLSWTPNGDVNVSSSAPHQGAHDLQILATAGGTPATAAAVSSTFRAHVRGVVSVWLRRGADEAGSGDALDVYLDGDGIGNAAHKVAAGLGGNGKFHYWGGEPSAGFVDMPAAWSPETWYFMTIVFNTVTDAFVFAIQDNNLAEIDRVDNLPLGNPASYIDTAVLYAGGSHPENAGMFADDLRMHQSLTPEPTLSVGDEQIP